MSSKNGGKPSAKAAGGCRGSCRSWSERRQVRAAADDTDTLLQAAHRTTDYMYIDDTNTLLQAAHRTTDYMYIDTGVENSSLYRAATAGLVAKL